ncbi:MAG: isopropylmalate isomerase, partial [Gemmatimonadaceae bacterium]|nr:isopropylmalate isomerase [Gloeobacterales cyanobacterium ES-bin-141]
EQVFADDRTQPEHPFNQPHYRGAKILVTNRNFGCGSSREHAPQALAKWGIEAVVGESFAEIFLGNCVAMGIPCVIAPPAAVKHLQQLLIIPATVLTIDLEVLQVHSTEFCTPITIGTASRQMFLAGTWDACAQLVSETGRIRATAANLPYLNWTRT